MYSFLVKIAKLILILVREYSIIDIGFQLTLK